MTIKIKEMRINSIVEMEEFLNGSRKIDLEISSPEDKYKFISETLVVIRYKSLRKKDKTIAKKYLNKTTGYSKEQIKRLVKRWQDKGLVYGKKNNSSRKYNASDIALLIKTDSLHKTRNGKSAKKILIREHEVFKKEEYRNISEISVSHIYNIRNHNRQYLSSPTIRYSKTVPVNVNIGERRKPDNQGIPGYIRVDSVHQGDFEGIKGVYHINMVDEVTQWEVIGCVPEITKEYMTLLLQKMIDQYPFKILNFHSDNGGEYINYKVSEMLQKAVIFQTKSRSRKSTDNSLVEGKNGAVIRKHMGRSHIPSDNAERINEFYIKWFNSYLNFHRTCAYATDHIDSKGKIRKKYDVETTPYERLKSISNVEIYLKEGVTFEKLDETAYNMSDNDFAEKMQNQKKILFNNLSK